MIVTIDGPAGAGKSSAARALAERLGFRFLDTGAMYRAVAWAALRRGIDVRDTAALDSLIPQLELNLRGTHVLLNGEDVTHQIRTPEVTHAVRFAADSVPVRQFLSKLQRQIADAGSIVTEGRDQGTVVFPDADCKIFLTASPAELRPPPVSRNACPRTGCLGSRRPATAKRKGPSGRQPTPRTARKGRRCRRILYRWIAGRTGDRPPGGRGATAVGSEPIVITGRIGTSHRPLPLTIWLHPGEAIITMRRGNAQSLHSALLS